MITFYTALVFSYYLDSREVTVTMLLSSMEQCQQTLEATNDLYNYIGDHVSGYDQYMYCEPTEWASSSVVRPKLRPKVDPMVTN